MWEGNGAAPPPAAGGGGGTGQPPSPPPAGGTAGNGQQGQNAAAAPPPAAAAAAPAEPVNTAAYGALHSGPGGLLDPYGYAALEQRQQELEIALQQRRQALASQLHVEDEMNYARQMAAADLLNRAEAERLLMQREEQMLAYETEAMVRQAAESRERMALLAEAEAAAAAHAQLAAATASASASASSAAPPPAPAPTAAAPAADSSATSSSHYRQVPAPTSYSSHAAANDPTLADLLPEIDNKKAAPAPAVAKSASGGGDAVPIAPAPSPSDGAAVAASDAAAGATAAAAAAAAAGEKKTPTKSKAAGSKSKSKAGGSAKKASPGTGKAKKAAAGTKRKAPAPKDGGALALRGPMPSLEDAVPPITDQDYTNLEALMIQFCRVPLLAEFSRPVSLLHPELIPVYSKVVKHPVDLGKVCRSVRRREYKDTRAVRLEMWRIFANCIKFHCHPSTREGAIPSFVSIALHLREYFNALWEEYMLPSDKPPPLKPTKSKIKNPTEVAYHKSFGTREERRKKRLAATATTALSTRCLEHVASELESFVDTKGRVDVLDTEQIQVGEGENEDYEAVMTALMELKSKLETLAEENEEYSVHELEIDLKKCYSTAIFDDRPALRKKFAERLNRLLGKTVVPIYETNCRGVNQSSIWGCMAAAIWARESSKKPFWPSLVLGIMAPEDQKEDWHQALTERNEARLPDGLRQQLETGKKKATQAIKRQSNGKAERMSFFLVEFLGTHEFTWVKESDIVEQFDPEEDPDEVGAAGKKKKHHTRDHRHTPQTERLRQKAVEEGRWALEEFEMQLNDTCGDLYLSDVDEDEEDGYTYDVLCQSDDDEDEDMEDAAASAAAAANAAFGADDEVERSLSDDEEIVELLTSEGMLDYSAAGRKTAKKRIAAIKKIKSEKLKAEQKKKKAEQDKKKKAAAKKAKDEQARKRKLEAASASKSKAKTPASSKKLQREQQKEQKELEKRRKKRERERELLEKKAKKARLSTGTPEKRGGRKAGVIPDKKGRATAVVRGYLTRIAKQEDLAGLGFTGASALPASAVEATGLLGMALAFRAAAGYVEMPVGKGEEPPKKPWDQIDTEGHAKSEDRCKNLERKAELLQQEISRIGRENNQRKVLIEQAHRQREANERKMIAAEERIKKVPAGVAKKKSKAKAASGKTSPVP